MRRAEIEFLFFKAEDGIRDGTVTGVQTCALPILWRRAARDRRVANCQLFPWSDQRSQIPPSTQEARMSIIGIIFIGLIVGLIARFIKPGNDRMGWIMTILLGVGGSVAATYGGQALGIYKVGESAGFIGAVIGAVVLMVIYAAVRKD